VTAFLLLFPIFDFDQSINYEFEFGQLCKIDITSGATTLWKESEFVFPGEPIFVPNPEIGEEDAGVLMTTCSDVRSNTQDFVIFLNAKTMTEIGRARVSSQIPQSLHGIFLPAAK